MNVKLVAPAKSRPTDSLTRFQNPWRVSSDDFPIDESSEEKLWFMLNYAVLAPSSHNTQPWRFRIHSYEVDLCADRTRALPASDPDDRELTMSCGAALFHLRVALQYFGYSSRVEFFPESNEPDLLARVHMGPKCETEAEDVRLFQAIPKRRTNRLAFTENPVPEEVLAVLEGAAQTEGGWLQIATTDDMRISVADLVAEADRIQWANRSFRQELAAWVHPDRSTSRDGMALSTQGFSEFTSRWAPLILRTFDLGKGHAAKDRDIALGSPVLAVLGTDTDDALAWISAGQALARVLLRGQAEDISASFLNQPIELRELRPRLCEAVGRSGFPQVLLRLGYGTEIEPTPRRSVSEVLLPRH
jgi:nitroreductase